MRADTSHSREEWFIPHETTITLPDGSKLAVDGIPYEGWGTTPGRRYSLVEVDDNGMVIWERRWLIPLPSEQPG